MRRLLLLLLVVCSVGLSAAERPTFLYDVDFVTYFRNTEGQSAYEEDGTTFGIRLTPAIGLGYTDTTGCTHRLMVGASYIQPFGSQWRDARVFPVAYYTLGVKGFDLNFGFVPYDRLLRPLPTYLMGDEVRFLDPVIRGALLQFHDQRGEVELLCDWRGMMSDTVREAFRIIGTGRGYVLRGDHSLYLGGTAMLNHLSHSRQVLGVIDDITIQPHVGYGYANGLSRYRQWGAGVEAGYLMSWQRDRRAGISEVSHGFLLEADLQWWFVTVRQQLYAGGNAMSLYPTYGRLLNQGDPRYQAPIYSQTEFRLQTTRWRYVTLYASWSIVYTKGSLHPGNIQQVYCRFNLDELMKALGHR